MKTWGWIALGSGILVTAGGTYFVIRQRQLLAHTKVNIEHLSVSRKGLPAVTTGRFFEFDIKSFPNIGINVDLGVQNDTSFNFMVEKVSVDAFINNTKVTQVRRSQSIPVAKKAKSIVAFDFEFNLFEVLGAAAANIKNPAILLKGHLNVKTAIAAINYIPVNLQTTVKDLIS